MDREYLDQDLIDLGIVTVETKGTPKGDEPDGAQPERSMVGVLSDD